MRIKLEFKLKKHELPLTYRKSIISFIKKSLKYCCDKYFFLISGVVEVRGILTLVIAR